MVKDNSAEEPLAEYDQPLNFEKVWKMFQETDRMFQETDKKFQETDKKLNRLESLFTSQWGKLIESLVEGDLIKLLQNRGIEVDSVLQRRKGCKEGQNFEYDLIAVNSSEIVIFEVKTTLRPNDVNYFHEKLWKAKRFMSEYRNMKIYGAVAFLSAEGASDQMAENQGLFVIKATGSSSSIVNKPDFTPKEF